MSSSVSVRQVKHDERPPDQRGATEANHRASETMSTPAATNPTRQEGRESPEKAGAEAMTYFESIRKILSMRLRPAAKVLLVYLLDKQGDNADCWPSITTICRECKLARATVVKAKAELLQAGCLNVVRASNPSVNHTDRYKVVLTGSQAEPVHNLNRFRGYTATGSESELQPVHRLNSNDSYNDSYNDSGKNAVKKTTAIPNKDSRKNLPSSKKSCGHVIEYNNKAKKLENITVDDLQLWGKTYPDLSIEQEIRKMESWLDANPTRRPKSNYRRFINGWLSRAKPDATNGIPATRVMDEDEADELLRKAGWTV